VLILAAPIREEIEFRLFIVSLLVWALGRLRKTQGAPRHLLWLVISISGIAFGLLHVVEGEGFVWWCPIYVQVFVDARTYIGGLLAWLYWNRGIETAIIAHMVLNGMV
jgi:membrane protease YdiL (CAAX protease family)